MYKCNLKFFLRAYGIQQKDLAKRAGLTEAMVSRIIKAGDQGRTGSIKTWFNICEALDCNIYDLWEVIEDGKAEETKVQ